MSYFHKLFLYLSLIATLSVGFSVHAFAEISAKNANSYTWTLTDDNKWICTYNSKPVKGWVEYNNEIYYLDKNGIMKTGWLKISSSWYYLDETTGILAKDTWIDNYYVDSNGEMTKIK